VSASVPVRSLWAATAAPGTEFEPLTHEVRAQVVVVGAGYTGLSAALHLGGARDVVVLEASEVGERASGVNGGQVIPGLKHDPDTLEEMFGPVMGPRLVATVAGAADVVFDLIRQHDIACAAIRTGWIQPATSDAALEAIATRVAQWRGRGADVQLLSVPQVTQLTGSQRYSGGWIDRRGGTVQPLSYVRGLARAAQTAGARIFVRSPATRLERIGREWRLSTPGGSVTSPTVILATDAYTDGLVDSLRRTLIPVPSLQVATEPLPSSLRQSVLPEGQSASDTWHLLRYFRLDPCGRLVMGSRGAFGAAPAAVAVRHHYRAVREIYPQLEGIRYEFHWGGLVAMTRDHLPHLHEVAPGVLAGLGYNGRGIAMATVMGRILAQWALGTPSSELSFPVTSLAPIPLHRFNQMGARLAIQGLRAVDGLARLRARFTAAGSVP